MNHETGFGLKRFKIPIFVEEKNVINAKVISALLRANNYIKC